MSTKKIECNHNQCLGSDELTTCICNCHLKGPGKGCLDCLIDELHGEHGKYPH